MFSSVMLSAPRVHAGALSGTPLPRDPCCSIALLSSRTLLHWPSHVPHMLQAVRTLSLLSIGTFGIAQLRFLSAQAGFGTEVEFRAVDCDLLYLVACANMNVLIEVCFCMLLPQCGQLLL